ncbi:uncharacterized protein [Musca autumnalis]|uniref:uncharacterized protein n=1 Tax=Musca autumnalis TaxID=221902 RepID=UPI003CE89B9F
MDESDISVRLGYVDGIHNHFEEAQSMIINGDAIDSETEIASTFVNLYFDVKAKLSRELGNKRKRPTMPHSSTIRQFSLDETLPQRKLRLPELKIPQFNGSYTDWPGFIAMFNTVIDNDNDLSKIEKFQHLRVSVTGAALDTISSLDPTEENYDKALELLRNRFDNKLFNFQAHIRENFGLKSVDKGSAGSLRQLSDKLNSHMRALQSICKQEEIADGFLIYLVTSKLDAKSQAKWEEDLPSNKLPTWSSLASFLERRCRMLENLESSMGVSNSKVSKKWSSSGRSALVASATPSSTCAFCDSQDHYITGCPGSGNLSPSIRFKEAKKLQLCLNCLKKGHMLKKCKSSRCRICSSKHHSMLHMDNVTSDTSVHLLPQQTVPVTKNSSQSALVSSSMSTILEAPSNTNVLLATAVVLVKSNFGEFIPYRALLDSASQLNFITRRAANQLHLKVNNSSVTVSGIGSGNFVADKSVDLTMKPRHGDFATSFVAVVVPTITDYQPISIPNVSSSNLPPNIKLADPNFGQHGRIDILIGAGLFFDLLCVGQIRLNSEYPLLPKTVLGWVASGGIPSTSKAFSLAAACKCVDNVSLAEVIQRFWEVENNFMNIASNEDDFCEQHFKKNTVRLDSGDYSVRLPKKESGSGLGSSYDQSLRRFLVLEKRLNKQPDVKQQYVNFMKEYSALNHMSLVPSLPKHTQTFFLPHHCVRKEDSTTTKLRVVFDGSAKTTTGVSLNDVLSAGPTIQPKLFDTLLRFRFFKVALSGDICKMYRCVRVSNPDNYLQCVLWRNDPAENIGVYKLDTVTYGTKPAAFLAIRGMHQLSYDEEESYPLAAKIVRCDLNFHDGTDITKALGLVWDPKADTLIFTFMPTQESCVVTKRTVLSCIARLYDPLGLIGPVISRAKVIMQTLWKHNLQWDESLPQSLHTAWSQFVSQFTNLHKFIFPRFVSVPNSTIQIHAFCDASLSAYGACVYARSECNGKVTAHLLCSKSRVAPLKVMTVPKLELSAAALLADLLDGLSKVLPKDLEYHCWSDSMVVLSWIREQPSNFNVFVSNRVSRIQSITSTMKWHYVPTNLNPSDILSRGASPTELLNSRLWKQGPDFLVKNSTNWPQHLDFITELPERRRQVLATSKVVDISLTCKYYNSFPKMQRIFGYIHRFISQKSQRKEIGKSTELSLDDIKIGTCLLITSIQRIHFENEYKRLSAGSNVEPSKSPDDLDILTPSHFLVGAPLVSIMEPDVTELNINTLNRWQRVSYMQQIFWKKWSSSSLSQLQERNKWRAAAANVKDGDLVMLRDENMPPLKWQLGRVSSTIAGKYGVVRVAIIKTTNGTCRRAVTKLAVLPIEKESVESLELPTGGG